MLELADPSGERDRVLAEIQSSLNKLRVLTVREVTDLESGITFLADLRRTIYEDINQLQHEALILRAIEWLRPSLPAEVHWLWNPRQQGGRAEPDLRAVVGNEVMVSAEAFAAELPRGVIDSRIRQALEKLLGMEGRKFYFACTPRMERRARSKARNLGLDITVQLLTAHPRLQ
jgi:hypothetical protein